MRIHVQVIAWLNIALGVLSLLGGALIFLAVTLPGFFIDISTVPLFAAGGALLGGIAALSGLVSLVVGNGLLQLAPWARVAAIVLSILHLANATTFGLSTILGIYSLIILFLPETGKLFDRGY
jgi:hypothetical protein